MTSGASTVRRLTARSAVLSTLLGVHPARASAGEILAIAMALGLRESAVRVALTRMVAAGDLDRDDGVYQLSARLLDRQRRQDDAVSPTISTWDGSWRLLIVTVGAEDATDRLALREALRAMRCGEIREGVWGRPDNVEFALPEPVARRVSVFAAIPQESSRDLADRLFAPADWARDARTLLSLFDTTDAMAERFAIAAAVVRHILRDPLLPERLLPQDWPGATLRSAYAAFRREFAQFVTDIHGSPGFAETHI